ncbi:MAG: RagB/SusD family nutrient uptake outer membrane protein, partial [Bacteroidales bacterium]|nr:RagB/SusD family nutrient uptake outer membrane protein [Bacteroidales bacterium]
YFIKAEATALNGNVAEAKSILNSLIKTRDASYDCSNIADNFFQSEIYRQKVIEFWGEGIVFHDAKRIGAGMHNGYPGTNVPGDFRLNCTGVCPAWNFVIPKTEINGNPALDGNNNPDPTEALEPWEE